MFSRLLLLALLAPALAYGQATPSPGQSFALPTRVDTLQAIHSLFKAKRTTGSWLVGGSGAVVFATGVGTAAGERGTDKYFASTAPEAAVMLGVGTAPAWVPGIISLVRFNSRREQAVLRQYEEHATLPGYVRKRLSERRFAER